MEFTIEEIREEFNKQKQELKEIDRQISLLEQYKEEGKDTNQIINIKLQDRNEIIDILLSIQEFCLEQLKEKETNQKNIIEKAENITNQIKNINEKYKFKSERIKQKISELENELKMLCNGISLDEIPYIEEMNQLRNLEDEIKKFIDENKEYGKDKVAIKKESETEIISSLEENSKIMPFIFNMETKDEPDKVSNSKTDIEPDKKTEEKNKSELNLDKKEDIITDKSDNVYKIETDNLEESKEQAKPKMRRLIYVRPVQKDNNILIDIPIQDNKKKDDTVESIDLTNNVLEQDSERVPDEELERIIKEEIKPELPTINPHMKYILDYLGEQNEHKEDEIEKKVKRKVTKEKSKKRIGKVLKRIADFFLGEEINEEMEREKYDGGKSL